LKFIKPNFFPRAGDYGKATLSPLNCKTKIIAPVTIRVTPFGILIGLNPYKEGIPMKILLREIRKQAN